MSFMVRTFPLDKEVKRRDRDFNILREYLVKQFPHVLIPPISEILYKNSTTSQINERKNILEKYVNLILKSDQLKSSNVVLDFLTASNEKVFHKQLK
jgi:hypothetical protein